MKVVQPPPLVKARDALAKARTAHADELAATVAAVLANELVNGELKRKLAYCQAEIDKGRDDGLKDMRSKLLAQAQR